MELCNQIHDHMPTELFIHNSNHFHNKYKLSPLDNERLEFAIIDVNKIAEEF